MPTHLGSLIKVMTCIGLENDAAVWPPLLLQSQYYSSLKYLQWSTVFTGSTVLHSTAQLCPYTKWYSSVFLSTTAFQLFLQWFKMFCSRVHLSSVADTRSSSFSAPSLLWIAPSLQPTPPHGIPLLLRPPPKCFIPFFLTALFIASWTFSRWSPQFLVSFDSELHSTSFTLFCAFFWKS